MNTINYPAIRSRISIRQVLQLLHYKPVTQCGSQWRGPCPICASDSASVKDRCFSVDVDRSLYQCFRCHRAGNQLDLWASISGRSLYAATLDLCHQLGIQPIHSQNTQPPNGH